MMRTTAKIWDALYVKMGQINLQTPLKNKVVKQTMKPWRYTKQAKMIAERLNAQDSVLEIGCGYGGLALEILKLVPVKYTVVENKIMLLQTKRYLDNKVTYVDAKNIEILQGRKFKLFISHSCLAETPLEYREYILRNIIKNCQRIHVIDLNDGIEPTAKMLEDGYEIIPLDIEKWLRKYFVIEKARYQNHKNVSIYTGERRPI